MPSRSTPAHPRRTTLLYGQDRKAHAELRRRVFDFVKPKDVIEEIFADDFVFARTAQMTLQDAATSIANADLCRALDDLLEGLGVLDPDLARTWIQGDADAREEVSGLLQDAGLDAAALGARALANNLPLLQDLTALAEGWRKIRNAALRDLEDRRAQKAVALQLDPQPTIIDADPDDAPAPPALRVA